MKITNNTIEQLSYSSVLAELSDRKDFPVQQSFQLAMLIKELAPISEVYFKSKRQCIDRYAVKDDKGNQIKNEAGYLINNTEGFLKEMKDLLDTEINLNCDKPTINKKYLEEYKISAKDIVALCEVIDFK